MADWRQNDSSRPPKSKPSGGQPPLPPADVPQPPRREWRTRRGAGASPSQPSSTPQWASGHETSAAAPSSRQLLRWSGIIALTALIVGLLGWYIYTVLFIEPRTPVYALLPGPYQWTEVAQHPFGEEFQDSVLRSDQEIDFRAVATTDIRQHLFSRLARDRATMATLIRPFQLGWGGPDRRAAVWIAGGVAYTSGGASSPGELRLLSPAGTDQAGRYGAEHGVAVAEMLAQIAAATPAECVSVVLLDLSTPPVVTDLYRATPPLGTAMQATWDALTPAERQRLVVAIPADDAQHPWMAPELNRSVFAYFVEQAIAGAADTSARDGVLTLGELRQYVDRNVARWVDARRADRQTPRWFVDADAGIDANLGLLACAPYEATAPALSPHVASLRDRADALWHRLERHATERGLATAPLEIGALESQLILMEQLVQRGGGSGFGHLAASVEAALDELDRRPPPVESVTTLHEQRVLEGTRWRERDIEALVDRWRETVSPFADPSTSSAGNDAGASTTDSAPADLPEAMLAAAVWRYFAPSNNRSGQSGEGIDPGTLEAALRFLDAARQGSERDSGRPEWLEIHFLRLIASEVDWRGAQAQRDSGTIDNVAQQLCMVLDDTLRVSAIALANPEAHPFLAEELGAVESQWIRTVDLLLANQFNAAAAGIGPLMQRSGQMLARAESVDRLLRLRNQAAHDLPHLLRWILTEYAISGSAPPGVDGVEDWIDVAQGWIAAERATSGDPTEVWADAETLVTALAPLGRMRQAYAEYVRNNGGTETGIPLTAVAFRRIEHMLTNPATPAGGDASTREVLAAKYMRFLSSPATPGAIDQRDGGQDAGVRNSAAEGAPSDSADSDGPTPLSRAHERLCQALPEWFAVDEGPRAIPEAMPLAAGTAGESFVAWRLQALQLRPEGRYVSRDQVEQLRREFRRHIAARIDQWRNARGDTLVHYAFGNGARDGGEPYFARAARVYGADDDAISRRLEAIAGVDVQWGEHTYLDLDQVLEKPLHIAAELWSQRFGDREELASVYVTAGEDRMRMGIGSQSMRAIPVAANEVADVPRVEYDLAPFRDPTTRDRIAGVFAFRGHHVRQPLHWVEVGTDVPQRVSRLDRAPEGETTVAVMGQVRAQLRVMLLVDLSGSMNESLRRGQEADGAPGLTILQSAKTLARQLIDDLADLQESEQVEVHIGMVAFGPPRERFRSALSERLRSSLGIQLAGGRADRSNPRDHLLITDIQPLTDARRSDLKQAVDDLEAFGQTPLYRAVEAAYDRLLVGGNPVPDATEYVVVISDGVNDYVGESRPMTESDLASRLKRRPIDRSPENQFHILFFDNPDFYRKDGDRQYQKYAHGKRVLAEWMPQQLGQSYEFFAAGSFGDLQQKLDTLWPRTIVRVQPRGGEATEGPLSTPLAVRWPGAEGIAKVDVTAEGIFGRAALGDFPVYRGDRLMLALDSSRRQLLWPDAVVQRVDSAQWGSFGLRLCPLTPVAEGALEMNVDWFPQRRDVFPQRPREVLAEIEVRGTRNDQPDQLLYTLRTADHEFHSIDSHPRLRLGSIPWSGNGAGEVPKYARLRLFCGETPLRAQQGVVYSVTMKPGDVPAEITDGEARLRISHLGDRVEAVVEVGAGERTAEEGAADWIVRVMQPHQPHRAYATDHSRATHTLRLADPDSPVEVQCFRFGAVAPNAASHGLAEIVFEPLNR